MRRNSFLVVFSMTLVLLAGSSINLRAQTKSATEKEKAPLRVALAGLVHGHASGFFDQFQHREDLQVVGNRRSRSSGSRHNLPRATAWRQVSSIPTWRKC